MEQLEHYRAYIQVFLEKHSQYKSREEDVESQLFFDTLRDQSAFVQQYADHLQSPENAQTKLGYVG